MKEKAKEALPKVKMSVDSHRNPWDSKTIIDTDLPGDVLADELVRLGVVFIRCPTPDLTSEPLDPITLVAGLASSSEARLRLSIIPLLLWRPDLASSVQAANNRVPARSQLTLQCFYTAALLLQAKHFQDLKSFGAGEDLLPDLFSTQLGMPPLDNLGSRKIDHYLASLGTIQLKLSGEPVNWVGSYHYAANTLIKNLKKLLAWTI
jgi:hypothetical protein